MLGTIRNYVLFFVIVMTWIGNSESARGFLKSPTARAATWKYFSSVWNPLPVRNTDYDSLNCGKRKINDGNIKNNCGVCGDPLNGPRNNEIPNGKYAVKRKPTFVYHQDAVINVTIEVTENGNGGYYQFKLCKPFLSYGENQDCFDKNVLSMAGMPGKSRIAIPQFKTPNDVVVQLQLPTAFTCNLCTMQWMWVTEADYGCEDVNGKRICSYGRGPQTTLVNCADITILPKGVAIPKDFKWPDYKSKYDSLGHEESTHFPTKPLSPETTEEMATKPLPPLPTSPSKLLTPLTLTPPTSDPKPTKTAAPTPPLTTAPTPPVTLGPTFPPTAAPNPPTTPAPIPSTTVTTPGSGPLKPTKKPRIGPVIPPLPAAIGVITLLESVIPGSVLLGLGLWTHKKNKERRRAQLNRRIMNVEFEPVAGMLGPGIVVPAEVQNGGVLVNRVVPRLAANGRAPVIGLEGYVPNVGVNRQARIMGVNGGTIMAGVSATQRTGTVISGANRVTAISRNQVGPPTTNVRNNAPVVLRNGMEHMDGTINGIPVMNIISQAEANEILANEDLIQLFPVLPLLLERRRIVEIFPHLNPRQISMIHSQYRRMQTRTNANLVNSNNVPSNANRINSNNGRRNFRVQFGGQQIRQSKNQIQLNQNSNFFELPTGHSFTSNTSFVDNNSRPTRGDIVTPKIEFDREPEVVAQREIIGRRPISRVSAYSNSCQPEKQTCTSKFIRKEPTLYGSVSIFGMICEIECSDGKPSCPKDICICTCPGSEDEVQSIFDSLDIKSIQQRQNPLG